MCIRDRIYDMKPDMGFKEFLPLCQAVWRALNVDDQLPQKFVCLCIFPFPSTSFRHYCKHHFILRMFNRSSLVLFETFCWVAGKVYVRYLTCGKPGPQVSKYHLWKTWRNLPHTHNCFMTLYSDLPGWASTRENIQPLTPLLVISHSLSTSSIYRDP